MAEKDAVQSVTRALSLLRLMAQGDGGVRLSDLARACLLYTSPSPRDVEESRMPSSA